MRRSLQNTRFSCSGRGSSTPLTLARSRLVLALNLGFRFGPGVTVFLLALTPPPPAHAEAGRRSAPLRAWLVAPKSTSPALAGKNPRAAPRERNMSVVYEVRLPGGLDAERLELSERPLRAGERYVVEGRLARLVLEPRPWNGDRWLVRYVIEPKGAVASRGRPEPGVFEITAGEAREFIVAGRVKEDRPALHAIRLDFGPRAAASSGGVRL